MSNRAESLGIYADLANKRSSQYDFVLEGQVKLWIEGNIRRKLNGNFRESLCDGVALCELINVIRPGMIPKIHQSKVTMFCRENFGFFQRSCIQLGCKDNETCVFEDVFENRNMNQFLLNIVSLARNIQYSPSYRGPILQDAVKAGASTKPVNSFSKPYNNLSTPESAYNQAQKTKDAGRYNEHGVMMNPDDNKYHGQKTSTVAASQSKTPPSQPQNVSTKKTVYCGDYSDTAMRQAQLAKDSGRYNEHGVMMNPNDNKYHGQKTSTPSSQSPTVSNNASVSSNVSQKKTVYCGDYSDTAMRQAQLAKDSGRYNEHGVMMNPNDNKYHGQKTSTPSSQSPTVSNNASVSSNVSQKKTVYCGDYSDTAMRQAQLAKDSGRYNEHGVMMNPNDNKYHGQKSNDMNPTYNYQSKTSSSQRNQNPQEPNWGKKQPPVMRYANQQTNNNDQYTTKKVIPKNKDEKSNWFSSGNSSNDPNKKDSKPKNMQVKMVTIEASEKKGLFYELGFGRK
ncbi:hypothetical protein TRFO_14845 [Tritrichomonas foetus]|uniref:Calponin-homology (CH) domain-containing protein n=1 Tax=Tritrichomonas foetus TaxID=1144522 RepID=A0A1J4KTQ3_9EUKA|nr:hypothetical protein TRFO_14845 [Tritrichomonas foetus]|eukprot:OHT14673.1 hypothetical protein TRFO_14845 [Tritrichomonas foetus]